MSSVYKLNWSSLHTKAFPLIINDAQDRVGAYSGANPLKEIEL